MQISLTFVHITAQHFNARGLRTTLLWISVTVFLWLWYSQMS